MISADHFLIALTACG